MNRQELLERVDPLSRALVLGQGWMAHMWVRAKEPLETSELVRIIHERAFDLFKDIIEEKSDHNLPFLSNGRFVCHNCQGAMRVTGFGPPFFIWAKPDTDLIIQTSCDTQCTEIEWQFHFPEGWDGGPNFLARLTVIKSVDWEF